MVDEKHPQDAFEQLVQLIHHLITEHGLEKVGSIPEEGNKSEWDAFIAACHEGYCIAQELMVMFFLDTQRMVAVLKQDRKRYRRNGDKTEANKLSTKIHYINGQQTVMRKLADSLAWILLNHELWQIRRFHLGENPPILSSSNFESCLEASRDIYEANPRAFALISDLTSVIQIGDLLVIDMSVSPLEVRVVELKEGRVNDEILAALAEHSVNQCPKYLSFLKQRKGDGFFKQFERVKKQSDRLTQVKQIVDTGIGIDPATKKTITIPNDVLEVKYYIRELENLVGLCKKQGVAHMVIDDCLHVFALDMLQIERNANGILNAIDKSFLGKDARPFKIFVESNKICVSPYIIHDLVYGLKVPTTMPIFILPIKDEQVFDITFGRTKVLSYIDYTSLLMTASSRGFTSRWVTKKEASRWKDGADFNGLLVENGKALVVSKNGKDLIVGDGILCRIVFDIMCPNSAIDMWEKSLNGVRS